MTLEATHRRREAVETIHDVVSAMRAIAAGRIQGAQHALTGARRYEGVVWQGLASLPAEALHLLAPRRGAPTLVVVMMSEQPLCGAFNQDLLAFVDRRRRELRESGHVEILVVGQRGARLLVSHGIEPSDSLPAAASLHGLREIVKQLAGLVGKRYAAGQLSTVLVAYNRYQSISEHIPTETQVLPPDFAPLSSGCYKPFHRYLSDAALLAGLVSELAFISLFRIAADSYASEQAARLIAMDGATRSTERLMNDLTELEQRERQEEITRQVLELIGARFAAR
jgi:F-type H+-transporting ATPase subunit gamma